MGGCVGITFGIIFGAVVGHIWDIILGSMLGAIVAPIFGTISKGKGDFLNSEMPVAHLDSYRGHFESVGARLGLQEAI